MSSVIGNKPQSDDFNFNPEDDFGIEIEDITHKIQTPSKAPSNEIIVIQQGPVLHSRIYKMH